MIKAENALLEWLDARTLGFATAYDVLPSRAAEADRVLNGGFEDWTAGAPDNWTTAGADSQWIEETTEQRSGTSCIRLERTNGATYGELYQAVQTRLERDAWYQIEYWIRGATAETTGDRLQIRNTTLSLYWDPATGTWTGSSTDVFLGGVDTVWRRRVAWFYVPASWDLDDSIRITWNPYFTVGKLVYLDDIVLRGPYSRRGLYFASQALSWYGVSYTAQATASEKSEEKKQLEVPTFEVELDHVNRVLRSYLEPVDLLTGGRLRVWLVQLDANGDPVETGEDPHVDGLQLGEWQIERPVKIDRERFRLPAVGLIDAHRQPVPRRRLAPWCSARFADGVDCLYSTAIATASGGGSGSVTLVLASSGQYAKFVAGDQVSIGKGEPVAIVSVNGTTSITLAAARSWSNGDGVKHTTCSREFDACQRRERTHEFLGFRGARFVARRAPRPPYSSGQDTKDRSFLPGPPYADPTKAVPILIGRRWIEGVVIELRYYTDSGPVGNHAVFFLLSEGACEELWGYSIDGERADSAQIATEGLIGPYVRVGAIGVNDDETAAEYTSDPTTEERAQNRDFRTISGTTYSRSCYSILAVDGGDFAPDQRRILWDLQGLLLQAYDAAGAASGSPAWSPSPIWGAVALLTSARFGEGLRTADVDLALAYVEAAYAATQIDSTVVNTTVTVAQGSATQTCVVVSTAGMRHGMACTVNGVANTIQRIVSTTELRLGTAVTQSIGHVVRGRPQRFEAHLFLDDAEQEAPETLEQLLAACRGFVTYDRGQVQLRIERAHVADVLAALNGNFDTWTSPTNAASWAETITGGAVNEETVEIHTAGGKSLELDRTTTGSLYVEQSLAALGAGYWLLTLWAKGAQSIHAALRIRIRNETRAASYDVAARDWTGGPLASVTYPVNTSWQQRRILFHVPTSWAADTISIRIQHAATSTNAKVYVDDVVLRGPLAGWYRDFDAPADAVATLLTNGTFESDLTGWTSVTTGGTATVAATAHGGAKAARLDRTGAGDLWILQDFAHLPGRRYALHAWVLTPDASSSPQIRVKDNTRDRWLDELGVWQAGVQVAKTILPRVTGQGVGIWTFWRLEFTTEADSVASQLRVLLSIGGSGAGPWAIYDDIVLEGPIDRIGCSHPGMAIVADTFEWVPRADDVDVNQVVLQFTAEGIQPGRDEAVRNDFEHQKRHLLRRKKIDGDAIADLDQAQRIADYHLRRARQLGPGSKFVAGPSSLVVQPGDVIAVSHDDAEWDLELQRVVVRTVPGLGDEDEGLAILETEDYDPTIYPDAVEAVAVDPSDSGSSQDLTVQAAPTNLVVESTSAISRPGTSGFAQARIRIGWDAPVGLIDHYEVRWKLVADTEYETAETRSTVYYIRNAGDGEFDVEVRAVNVRGVPSDWVPDTVTVDPGPAARIRTGTRFAELGGEISTLTRAPKVYTGQDGSSISLPANLYTNPIVLARLVKGKGPNTTYPNPVCRAINVSATGFTIYAKNEGTTSSPTYDNVAFSGTADDDGETVTATKAGDDIEPADDIHIIQFDVTVPRRQNLGGYPNQDWESGFVQVHVHARPAGGGAWQGPYFPDDGEYFYNDTTGAVVYANRLCTIDLNGLGASAEFKLTLVNWFGGSGTPSLTGDTVSWSTGSAPTSESATPSADHLVECLVLEGS